MSVPQPEKNVLNLGLLRAKFRFNRLLFTLMLTSNSLAVEQVGCCGGGWGNSSHFVGRNPAILQTVKTQQSSLLSQDNCLISPQEICKFCNFPGGGVSLRTACLLQINHLNNSNSADSGQSSFFFFSSLLQRETLRAITRKAQAELMTPWEPGCARLFLFIIITRLKHTRLRVLLLVCMSRDARTHPTRHGGVSTRANQFYVHNLTCTGKKKNKQKKTGVRRSVQ